MVSGAFDRTAHSQCNVHAQEHPGVRFYSLFLAFSLDTPFSLKLVILLSTCLDCVCVCVCAQLSVFLMLCV